MASLGTMEMKAIFYVIQICWSYSSLGKRPKTRPSSMNPVTIQWGAYSRRGTAYEPKRYITLNVVRFFNISLNTYTKRQLKLLRNNMKVPLLILIYI